MNTKASTAMMWMNPPAFHKKKPSAHPVIRTIAIIYNRLLWTMLVTVKISNLKNLPNIVLYVLCSYMAMQTFFFLLAELLHIFSGER
jgi:hypothetical protein